MNFDKVAWESATDDNWFLRMCDLEAPALRLVQMLRRAVASNPGSRNSLSLGLPPDRQVPGWWPAGRRWFREGGV